MSLTGPETSDYRRSGQAAWNKSCRSSSPQRSVAPSPFCEMLRQAPMTGTRLKPILQSDGDGAGTYDVVGLWTKPLLGLDAVGLCGALI